MTLTNDLQQPYAGQLVTLFELDCTAFDDGTILYFTSTAESASELVWNGNTYVAVDIEATGFEVNGSSQFPNPILKLSNVNLLASALVIANHDLIGATLTRIRTLRQYLDDGSTPDPSQIFVPDIYTVEQKTKHNQTEIEWKLSASVDQEGRKIPGFFMVRDYCTRRYRRWDPVAGAFNYNKATCRYTGSNVDINNNTVAVTGPNDACAKTLPACKAHFGVNAPLQFSGLPGLGRFT